MTSGLNPSISGSIDRCGNPTGNKPLTAKLGTRLTLKPAYVVGASALSGAITSASCPLAANVSKTRRTELVTPFTWGRKDSVTTATRSESFMSEIVRRNGTLKPNLRLRVGEG